MASCRHPDVRQFEGIRCCLACGEAVFDTPAPAPSTETTSTVSAPYEYTTLNYRLGQEVRLCVLLAGEPTDPLQCEIICVNLEHLPDYEAVSYTWASEDGDASLSRSIHCGNNRHLAITANCDTVLRQLRKRGLRRRLWIDAVSIDQNNANERTHQVGLMDCIYSRARSVRICIRELCVPIKGMGDYYEGPGEKYYTGMFRLLRKGSLMDTKKDEAWLFRVLVRLTLLRYFRRAWVLQEVALAATVYLHVNDDELLLTWDVMNQLDALARRNNFQLPGVLRMRWKANQLLLANIVTCLRAGLDSECTDPRDRVFAVLSFIDPQVRLLVPVDYSLEIDSVYTSAVIAVISVHRNLDILSHVGQEVDVDTIPDFSTSPSLTVDQFKHYLAYKDVEKHVLSNAQLTELSIRQFEREKMGPWRADIEVRNVDEMDVIPNLVHKDATIPVVCCRVAHISYNVLPRFQIRAHYLDRVIQTRADIVQADIVARVLGMCQDATKSIRTDQVNSLFPEYTWLTSCFQKALLVTQAHHSSQKLAHAPDHHSISVSSNYQQARATDLNLSGRINTASHTYAYAQFHPRDQQPGWLDQDNVRELDTVNLELFLETVKEAGVVMEMFSTSHSVGFARRGYEPGDEIWALDGARAPFILRSVAPKTYRIVSVCYLWAALELDYWNPGTKKGRWRPEGTVPAEEQTHIIEIH